MLADVMLYTVDITTVIGREGAGRRASIKGQGYGKGQ